MTETNGRTIPDWAKTLFQGYLDHLSEIGRLLHLSMRGIGMLERIPRALEAIGKASDDDAGDYEKRLESARQEAVLAETELANDFPLLHGQTLVTMWSSLESLVRSFIALWIENQPSVLSGKGFSRLKVNLSDYVSLTGADRARYVVDVLEQEMGSARKLGVNRFETLLEVLGLSGSVPDEVAKTLFEAQQVRNVIVHRRGLADRRFCDLCPWLRVGVGDAVRVRHSDFQRYASAVDQYVLELIQRLRVNIGMERFDPGDASARQRQPPGDVEEASPPKAREQPA